MITSVTSLLPIGRLEVADIAEQILGFDSQRLISKTQISSLARIQEFEFSSTLAADCAHELMERENLKPEDVDILIVVTQTADFLLPGVASLVHSQLGLQKDCLIFDVNDGCSGFVKGSKIMDSLLKSGSGRIGILVTVDTYSRIIDTQDRSTLPLFGDGAAAAIFGVDGQRGLEILDSGFRAIANSAGSLIAGNGLRATNDVYKESVPEERQIRIRDDSLFMDGRKVLLFAIDEVPGAIHALLAKNNVELSDVSLFAVHQANALVVSSLAGALGVQPSLVPFYCGQVGNITSSTIPLVLERSGALDLPDGALIVTAGFGVGLSVGVQLLRVRKALAK